jgi:two-component system cell cycle sensor histidine kinase/response regulator CckA
VPELRDRDPGSSVQIRLDAGLVCTTFKKNGSDSFGLPGESLIGKFFPELLAPSEMSAIVETLRSVVDESRRAFIIASFDLAGGLRWLELDVAPVDAGTEDGAALEITFRKSELGNEARYRRLVDNMRDGICEIGENGRILYASPSYAELFGGSLDRILGSDPIEAVHIDDRRRVSQLFRPGGRSRRQGALVYRAQNVLGDLLHLEATVREYIGEDDRPRVVVSTRDVTERENSRRSLERHISLETRVAELSRLFIDIEIDAIQAGVENGLARIAELAEAEHSWMYSFSAGKSKTEFYEWWRDSEQSGTSIEAKDSIEKFPYSTDLIRKGRVYQVTDVDDLPEAAENERLDMRERGVRSILGIPIMSRGQFVGFLGFESFEREINWPEETIMLLRMVGEIFFSALCRRRTAEELRRSQWQLVQSQKMEALGTLAGGIAHDFNNHLAVMLSNARFVRQEVDADSEVLSAIDDFERSADHCAQLTRSLLAFSRRSPVEVVPVEVVGLVQGVEGLVRPLLPSSIDFESRVMPDVGRFAVDQVQIQQVLVNLLVNARDAMPEGGPIRMNACRRPISVAESKVHGLDEQREYVVLTVEDSGHGMTDEVQSRVFEPFFTTKEVGHGTGLGLAMAYGIVRQSEGAIALESRPGEGTTFRVYLPSVGRMAK